MRGLAMFVVGGDLYVSRISIRSLDAQLNGIYSVEPEVNNGTEERTECE